MGRTGMYYLNNDGSRWRVLEDGKNTRMTWKTKSGKAITRAVKVFRQRGNFATCSISYKGHQIEVFPHTILKD